MHNMGTSAPPLPYTRLLSFLKYGTSLDRWYNWYIVYTTILDYNNHILFRVCQVYKRKVRHLEITPVTLSAAKGLARRTQRSFAALRMTARTPLKSAHGK